MQELSASKLTSPVRVDDASGDIPAPCNGVIDCVDGDSGFHPVRDGIPNNPPGEHVFDRTQVKLSFPGPMFRDIHQPKAIWCSCREVSSHEVVTHGRPRLFPSLSPGFHDRGHNPLLVA